MEPAQLLTIASEWVKAHLPYVVGIGVAAVVLVIARVATRRRGLDPARVASAARGSSLNLPSREKEATWEPPELSFADRRASVRREGPPVRVQVASPTFRTGTDDGYVLDRSTGGLRIALTTAVPPGSTLQVRAAHAPDTVGFVTVIVRSCRRNADFYEVGCEFEKTPPWNVLLLFG